MLIEWSADICISGEKEVRQFHRVGGLSDLHSRDYLILLKTSHPLLVAIDNAGELYKGFAMLR